MGPIVYIETTIPSFYYEVRTDAESVARRNWTRQWWDERRSEYELVTSQAVTDELQQGAYSSKEQTTRLLKEIAKVSIVNEVKSIAETYVKHAVMPRDPAGDALHLAIASYHKCDFLLTWNCHHLANANKFIHIRRINESLEIFCPQIVTPLELLGAVKDEP